MRNLIIGLILLVSTALATGPDGPVPVVPEPVKIETLDQYTSDKLDQFVVSAKGDFNIVCVKDTAEAWKATNIDTDLDFVVKYALERAGWTYASEGSYGLDLYIAEFNIANGAYKTGLTLFLFKDKEIYANIIILCTPTS